MNFSRIYVKKYNSKITIIKHITLEVETKHVLVNNNKQNIYLHRKTRKPLDKRQTVIARNLFRTKAKQNNVIFQIKLHINK